MTKLTTKRTINAPASQVWAVISDYQNAHAFHPLLESVEQISEAERGVGATRQCNLYNNSSVVEEVIAWEEGRSFTVQTNEQPIFGVTNGTMSVRSIDAHNSEVTVVTAYTPKWGIVGRLFDFLLLRMVVNNAVGRVLKGLQHHVESGELVGKGGRPISAHVQAVSS